MSENVIVEAQGALLQVRLDRPRKRNALTVEMYEQLNAAFVQLEESKELRCLVLSGSEDCFTAGNDLLDFMQNPPDENSPVSQFLANLAGLQKPMVVAVAGPAVGVGTTLLLHADLVYASENSRFRMPFTSLGVVPEAGSSYLLPRMVGRVKAAELLLLAEEFDAATAERLGLVNQVCEPGTVIDAALTAGKKIARLPPTAIRQTKALLSQGPESQLARAMAEEGRLFLERIRSPEAIEAMTAFMQRREPDFSPFE